MRWSPAVLFALAAAWGGCGGADADESARIRGELLTVYAGLPAHGARTGAGDATFAGARRALADSRGRAGRFRVRLVRLSSTRPEDTSWDPGTVEANAERAADDPTTIAYLGELEAGASAVSLPVTNRAGILQVTPADSLTSLTRRPPGKPRAGPERFYPSDRRTLLRLVPTDLDVAGELLRRAGAVRRPVVMTGEEIADRELGAMLGALLRRRGADPVSSTVRDLEAAPEAVQDVIDDDPDAVFLVGSPTPAVRATVAALGSLLPGVPVFATGWPAERRADATGVTTVSPLLPLALQPDAARRLAGRLGDTAAAPEAVYGYTVMRLVLEAVEQGAPDRRKVVAAALAPGERNTLLGNLTVTARGDAGLPRLAVAGPGAGAPVAVRAGP